MPDILILGGGVIGLSLAYELSASGLRVRVIDRELAGGRTSWAAAGILPPCNFRTKAPPPDWLAGFSNQLHAEWSARLREETGIDNGYRRCGGIHLADSDAMMSELLQTCERWRREGLTVKWLHAVDLDRAEPALAGAYDRLPLTGVALVAEEAQIRSPRHLQALLAACHKRGVEISSGVEAYDFDVTSGRVTAVRTNMGSIAADKVVLACGAWSQSIAARLGFSLPIRPIRGQIVLLNCGRPILSRLVNAGRQYLVSRDDGRVLVGSTQEDVGFDPRNTAAAIADLLQFAIRLVPQLQAADIERCWTGFRPRGVDDLPFLGPAPGLSNVYLATGHFRAGLWQSTGTAVVMSRLIRGESPGVDLAPFRPGRSEPATAAPPVLKQTVVMKADR